MISALIVVLSLLAAPHDNSSSQSLVEVTPEGVSVFLRVQAESALELPGVDVDANLWLDPAEFEHARDTIEAHLTQHWSLRVDDPSGEPIALELVGMELIEEGTSALDMGRFVEASWRAPGLSPRSVHVEMTLFRTTSPRHIDTCRVRWPDGSYTDARLWAGQPTASFAGPPSADGSSSLSEPQQSGPSFFVDLRLGVDHMLTGWDHLAFLLGLLAICRSGRALLLLVTAFTLAHSATLALAAYDLVQLPSEPVELGIALSIAYVGARGLVLRKPSAPWTEAGVFGLVHGLGFASQLARQLDASASPLQLLLGFNLGLEIGQLVVVGAILLLVTLLRLRPAADEDGGRALLPLGGRKLVSLGVLAAGLFWSWERLEPLLG